MSEPKPGSPRLVALRELAADAELERRDFLYEATEQLRRFLDANKERLREIGPIKLVDDEQDYLLYHPVDETWTTRLTYQDPADEQWYDQEQIVDTVTELVELYNPADIFAWLIEAARDAPGHLVASGRAGPRGGAGRGLRRGLAGRAAAVAAGDTRRAAPVAAGRRVPRAARHGPGPAPARVQRQRRGGAAADRRPGAARGARRDPGAPRRRPIRDLAGPVRPAQRTW